MKFPGLYRKTHTRIFYYQAPMIDGHRPKALSLETTDEQEAIERYYQVREDARRAYQRGHLRQEIARFLTDRAATHTHRRASASETSRVLQVMLDTLGDLPVHAITPEDLRRVYRVWTARQLSPATTAAYLARLRSFFTWAVEVGLRRDNPATCLIPKRDPIPTRSERYCTRAERETLIAACPPERSDLALTLWLGFFAGLRRREIDQARVDWIDLDAGVLRVQRTETFVPKTSRGVRTIRLSPRLHTFLSDYLSRPAAIPARSLLDGTPQPPRIHTAWQRADFLLRPDKLPKTAPHHGSHLNRYRFDTRRPLEQLVTACGLGWVGHHTMRHTWATLHAIAGTPIATIAKELGERHETAYHHYVGYSRSGKHADAID